jgi:predicted aldo/keto reductase-like oxidoreductase
MLTHSITLFITTCGEIWKEDVDLNFRVLGKTGLKVSILGFGGIPIRRINEKEAISVLNHALDLGINFIHTSITYGDSAYKIGKVMKERRDECFLTVKVGGRVKTEAEETLRRSLQALKTDHIDIAQLPVNPHDFPKVMGSGGAYEAFLKAQQEGIINFIGITSHDVDFLTRAINANAFSNLITPFNYVKNTARKKLLSVAHDRNMGVIAMKTLGKGGLSNISQALRYVWNHDIHTAIVGMNKLSEVDHNVTNANNLQTLTEEENKQLQMKANEIVGANRLSSSGAVF